MDLRDTPLHGGRVVGWARDGTELLMIAASWKPVPRSTLAAVRVSDGAIRVLHDNNGGRVFLPPGWRQDRTWKQMPLLIDPDPAVSGGFDLILLNIDDGGSAAVAHGVCAGAADLSEDGGLLAYATCPSTGADGAASELHLMDMDTRIDQAVAPLAGKAWRILISPAKDRFMIHRLRPAGGVLPALIVGVDGSSKELAAGWIPVGWQGRERVVLADDWPAGSLAVADAETGELRTFYPTPR